MKCRNRPGIVAGVSTCLFEQGGDIVEAQQFDDFLSGQFFARIAFSCEADRAQLGAALAPVAERLGLDWSLRLASERRRVLLMVSRFDHCLIDLLYRWRIGELPMDITGVVANYPRETYGHIDFGGVPFHYVPVTPQTRAAQEDALWGVIEASGTELVVLARYMQVLSAGLVARLDGRCINVHHSFLPGFKGARPYHQAYERGVKLIGATAHVVTGELDEGPIIEQDVTRISHRDRPEDLIRKGRDIERQVLARALRNILTDRVIANDAKTVVFGD